MVESRTSLPCSAGDAVDASGDADADVDADPGAAGGAGSGAGADDDAAASGETNISQ